MNDNAICFVICVNDESYQRECLHYIQRLHLPQGYTAQLICIRDAQSMAEGYNRAMNTSDARYKIYLHQDVFLTDRDLVCRLLTIFEDKTVGMVGVVGSPQLSKDAVMWSGTRIGAAYTCNVTQTGQAVFEQAARPWQEVEAIDGMFMATQYDIRWREDIFTGWDYYDVSQAAEFRRAGYKVVVPWTEKPWCLHDDGFMNLTDYFEWQQAFINEYR